MIRLIARLIARYQYIFKLEHEGATNTINAQLALNRAKEKRDFIDQLNSEADDIDANIAKEEATDEYKALSGQEKYEADREKDDAKKIAAEKRRAAEAEATNVSEGEKTAQYFRSMAENSRIVADKIRKL
jgi:hypothetical protein